MRQAAEVICTDIPASNAWGVRPMVALRIADRERVVPKRAPASLSAYVIVDRAWAQALGVPGLRGAQRVGKFYRLPRAEYRRLVAAHFDADITSGLRWTESDVGSAQIVASPPALWEGRRFPITPARAARTGASHSPESLEKVPGSSCENLS